jgi:hypothetical protein
MSTLCFPGVMPLMIKGSSLASAQGQGASSTVTWMWPMRGETPSAPAP